MIETFLNETVTIMRLQTTTGNKKALATTQTADGNIQNADTRYNQAVEGTASKTYMAWFHEDLDIVEGDILRSHTSNRRYKVIGVERHAQGMGLVAEHLEVIMVRHNL